MSDIGVVYLWRKADGVEPARRFVRSLKEHPAGVNHDFFVVLKGFDAAETDQALDHFAGFEARPIPVPDVNFDIGSYMLAARSVENRRLLFLNTRSTILADDWLSFYDRAFLREGVGLVGATGSWQSIYSVRYPCGLRVSNIYRIRRFRRDARRFPPFPNPHIRSNAFMIERERFLSLAAPVFKDKDAALDFESGYDGMTRKIVAMGLGAFVVDRHGTAFAPDEWDATHTFFSGDQEGLLISDKATDRYRTASPEARERLYRETWFDPTVKRR